jgi:tetrapyrrole methylase family protein/MazG family protein
LKVTVISIGTESSQVTAGAMLALKDAERVILRTKKTESVKLLDAMGVQYESLDRFYDETGDFDSLNMRICDYVAEHAPCLYAVPDASTDVTAALLHEKLAAEDFELIPGITGESAFVRGGPIISCPARHFEAKHINPAVPLLVTEIQSKIAAGELKLKLLSLYNEDMPVYFTVNGIRAEIPLYELDRQPKYDHTANVYVPASDMLERKRRGFPDLADVMVRLRDPVSGCPWDKEQTHMSLREFILEEACEVIEAIDLRDTDKLVDELGDSLLQVVFHAQVAKECGEFDVIDVTSAICEKLIRRHPHIFGNIEANTSEKVLTNWEAIKKIEKKLTTQAEVMRDIPLQLTALMRAAKVQKKAKQVGFDFIHHKAMGGHCGVLCDARSAFCKVEEESAELKSAIESGSQERITDELGDLLFSIVNVSRLAGVQSELALMAATRKFIDRFDRMEQAVTADGLRMNEMTADGMDAYWEKVKDEQTVICNNTLL